MKQSEFDAILDQYELIWEDFTIVWGDRNCYCPMSAVVDNDGQEDPLKCSGTGIESRAAVILGVDIQKVEDFITRYDEDCDDWHSENSNATDVQMQQACKEIALKVANEVDLVSP